MGLISLLMAWMWDRKERSVKDDFDSLSLTRRMKLPSTEIGSGSSRLDARDLELVLGMLKV